VTNQDNNSSNGSQTTTTNQTPVTASAITSVANDHNKGTKVELQTSVAAFVAGLLKYYGPNDVFPLKQGNMTRDQVIAAVQPFITAAEQTKASLTVWRGDVQAERAALAQSQPIRSGVKRIIQARFGEDGAQLLDFGYQPRKASTTSATTKAAAVVKGKATRQARGTKGRVQRQAIKGDVVGVVMTPVTATPAMPAAAPATPEPQQPAAVAPQAPAPAAGGTTVKQ